MEQREASGRTLFLRNIPYHQAQKILAQTFGSAVMPPETVPVRDCLGRVTAEPVFARISSPHYHASAMDGVAVNAQVTFGARETDPKTLTIGRDAFWVNTGDPLPPGTNAVIMVEHLAIKGEGQVEIIQPVAPWENVRAYGEDMVENDLIVPASWVLRPQDLGAILAGGVTEISVRKKPAVCIIPTGSELVPPTQNPGPGQIIEFNSTIFSSMIAQWGGTAGVHHIVPDDLGAIISAIAESCKQCDVVLVNAGSSHGSMDYTARAIESLGTVLVHGVATRPGKPVIIGEVANKPVIGLPGYPVSAVLAMELFVKPLIFSMLGLGVPEAETVKAVLSRSIVSAMGIDEFVRCKLGKVGERIVAIPIARGAALTTSLVRSDGTILVPRDAEGYAAGKQVEVILHRSLDEIMNQVIHIGSHDLTLDIIANLLRLKKPGITLSSANLGSLGGLMALRRREAHLAGTHLLDEETGEYNIPYIQKLLPNENIVLITLVHRQQGFIVLPGNPKGIRDVEDLVKPGVTFVNRQKGSGTRVLLDYALKRKGLNPEQISGYHREEYTHTQVAAAVKSGSADAGLGILSAAKALGLEFVPWLEERYDLAIPEPFMDHPGVRAVLELIRTDEFKQRVLNLGGYDTRETGVVQYIHRPASADSTGRSSG